MVTNVPMRSVFLRVVLVVLVVALAGCPNNLAEVCGLASALPSVDEGTGSATRSDGGAFAGEPASWSPGTNAAVTIGLLSMVVAKDETGLGFDELVADGALPICVPQGERNDTSGNAIFSEGDAFVTDAAHPGKVALLSLVDDVLVGRFELELVNSGSGQTIAFTEGVFAATRQ